ncbi:unnamed protein product [marine sediment metagenome]|uniref:Uncharacterized protein n=1 Tax=marine sediment metagenome TaxID=412755 RepID=X1FCL2_9ZZZZ
MKRRRYLLLGLLLLVGGLILFWQLLGCRKGGPLLADHIAYKHDAVVWAYRTGEQIGRFWVVVPVTVRNKLLDLQPGDGCVHVTEGQTGGQCGATPQAGRQLSHALDLRTGRSIYLSGPVKHVNHPTPVSDGKNEGRWETPIGDGLSVYSAGQTGRLYLCLPSEVLILELEYPDPEVTYRPWLGVPIAAFRMSEDLLVLGLSQGYVVCVDMRKLQISAATQTGSAHSSLGKQPLDTARASAHHDE